MNSPLIKVNQDKDREKKLEALKKKVRNYNLK